MWVSHDTGCISFGRRSLSVLPASPFTFLQFPSCPRYIHPFTDQPAESVSRFKQWFWSIVEKMTNEEKHDLVRQRRPLLVVGALLVGLDRMLGSWKYMSLAKLKAVTSMNSN